MTFPPFRNLPQDQTMPEPLSDVTILVPGGMHERVLARRYRIDHQTSVLRFEYQRVNAQHDAVLRIDERC